MITPMRGTWRVIFTDLTALLLALVVMMYAMTRVDERRWQALRAAWDLPVTLVEDGVEGSGASRGGLDGKPPRAPPAASYLATLMARQFRAHIQRGELELAEVDEHLSIRLHWPPGRAPTLQPPAWDPVVDYLASFEGCAAVKLPIRSDDGLVEALLHANRLATSLTQSAVGISTVALVRRENHLSSGGTVEIDLECSRSGP